MAEAAEAEVAALREVSLVAQKAYKHAMKEEKLTPRNSKRVAREAAEKTAKEVQLTLPVSRILPLLFPL